MLAQQRTFLGRYAFAALVLLGAVACTANETVTPTANETVTLLTDGGSRALVRSSNSSGSDVGISGELGLNEADCYGLALEEGEGVSTVVWPAGTEISSDGELVSPEGDILEVGESVTGGGGSVIDISAEYFDSTAQSCQQGTDRSGLILWSVAPTGAEGE